MKLGVTTEAPVPGTGQPEGDSITPPVVRSARVTWSGRGERILERRVQGPTAALGGCLLLLVGRNGTALLIALAVCAAIVPASTVVRRVVLGIPTLFGLTACVLTVAAVMGQPVDARVLLAGYLVVGGALVAAMPRRPRGLRFASGVDAWASAAGLLTFGILYRPFIGASSGQMLAALSYGTDTGTHIRLVSAILRHHGYVTFLPGLDPQLSSGIQHYPPALGGNLAMVVHLLAGPDPASTSLVRVVAPLLVGGYALLVWCAVMIVLRVIEAQTGRLRAGAAAVATASLALTVLLGFNIILTLGGYHTQVVATAALLAMVALLVDNRMASVSSMAVLVFIAVGAMQCWYLLAPLFGCLLMVELARRGAPLLPRLLILVVSAPFALFPVVNGPRFGEQVVSAGITPMPGLAGVVALLVAGAVGTGYLFRRSSTGRQELRALLVLLPPTSLLLAIVGSYQVIHTGEAGYYFIKLFYTTLLLCALLASAAMGTLVDRVSWRPNRAATARGIALSGLLLLGPVTAAQSSWAWVGPFVLGTHPRTLDPAILDAYLDRHPNGLAGDTDIWLLNGCNRFTDQIASKWAYDLSGTWDDQREKTWGEFSFAKPDDVSALVRRASDPDVRHIELYVSHVCEPEALEEASALPKTQVIRVP